MNGSTLRTTASFTIWTVLLLFSSTAMICTWTVRFSDAHVCWNCVAGEDVLQLRLDDTAQPVGEWPGQEREPRVALLQDLPQAIFDVERGEGLLGDRAGEVLLHGGVARQRGDRLDVLLGIEDGPSRPQAGDRDGEAEHRQDDAGSP